MELVQGQLHSSHRRVFICRNCGASRSLPTSLYTIRKQNSKSGNLFCDSRCFGMYRRNQPNKEKEESAKETLDNYFKEKELKVVDGLGVGEGRVNAPTQFFFVENAQNNFIALREQETKMAERMTYEEMKARFGKDVDQLEYEVDSETGNVKLVVNATPDTATPIETPTAPPTPPKIVTSSGTRFNIGGGNQRTRMGRFWWEYQHNASIFLIPCDAGNHEVPDAFLQTIPEKSIWAIQDGTRKPLDGPYPKCAYNTDEFGNTERTFINIIGLSQFLNPNDYDGNTEMENNHGQYRPGGLCNRCQGKNSNGEVISNGMMTTRNLVFNYTFDKGNNLISQDTEWEEYLRQRGLKISQESTWLAVPIKDDPNPFTS